MNFQLVKIKSESPHHLNEPQFYKGRILELLSMDGLFAKVRTVDLENSFTVPIAELEEFIPPRLPNPTN